MTDQEIGGSLGDLSGEVEQCVEDVLGTAQLVGSHCLAHAGEVGVDPPEPGNAAEDRLEAGLSLSVVNAGTVQHQD